MIVKALRVLIGDDAAVLRERQFQLLLLANVMPPLGSALLSPVLDSLIEPFGASGATIGLMMSAFTAPAVVMTPVIGVIADRFGRRPVIISGLLLFGTAGTAIALTTTFWIVLVLRLIQGVGFAALTPILVTSIGDIYSGVEEATAQGLRFAGSGVTQMVFPLIAGVLVVMAWQYPFVLYGLSFPIAVVLYRYFEEPVDASVIEGSSRDVRDQIADLREFLTHRRAVAMVFARGTPNIIWLGFLTYNSIAVVELMGGTPAQAGILAALGSLSYAIAASQAGRIMAAFDRRIIPLTVLNVAQAGGIAMVFLGESLPIAYAGVLVMGLGFGLSLTLYRSFITEMAPQSLRGGWVSFTEAMGRLTSTLTPVAMGAGIAVLSPLLGFESALMVVGVAIGVVAGGVGILSMIVIEYSPPIERPAPAR